jgi:hypothetical protein
MLVDKGGLWYKVLKAKYGEEKGRLKEGGRYDSIWWKELVRIRNGIRLREKSWFEENLRRMMSDGVDVTSRFPDVKIS